MVVVVSATIPVEQAVVRSATIIKEPTRSSSLALPDANGSGVNGARYAPLKTAPGSARPWDRQGYAFSHRQPLLSMQLIIPLLPCTVFPYCAGGQYSPAW